MIVVNCVIHRENLVAKNITPFLNGVLHSFINLINYIIDNGKFECLFNQFCENKDADYLRLLLHTEVWWISKENCLKRLMGLYNVLYDFLSDKPEMPFTYS